MSDLASVPTEQHAQAAFRVLIVDDDSDMAGLLSRMLVQQGMQAQIAANGSAALELIAESPPDLVLLDVQMPGPSGFDICRQLKSQEATALLPVVLVTALEDHDSRVRGIEAGADDFLSKPVRREELIARVKTLRRLHETRKELETLRVALSAGDMEQLRQLGHRMKGVGNSYGFELISVLGKKIEDDAKVKNLSALEALIAEYTDYLARVKIIYE